MENIIAIVYIIWAMYAGWKFMDGRFAFLERKGIGYQLLKFICAWGVGIIYGAIYFIILILQFLRIMSKL